MTPSQAPAGPKIRLPFDWTIDLAKFHLFNGHLQSQAFGTARHSFAFIAQRNANNRSMNLHLSLVPQTPETPVTDPKQSSILVDLEVKWKYENRAYWKCLRQSKELSLSGETTLGWTDYFSLNAVNAIHLSSTVTFQEPELTQKILKKSGLDHLETLGTQFAALLSNGIDSSDVTLITTRDGAQFPVHKNILSARSSVFQAMFRKGGAFSENTQNCVEIDDIDGEVMKVFLKYLYSGETEEVEKMPGDLLPVADKYDVQLLVQECAHAMEATLEVENAAQFFYLADLHHREELKLCVAKFIKAHRKEVRQTCGWSAFIGTNARLIETLFDLI